MPLSLNLPYAFCRPITRFARDISRKQPAHARHLDQTNYFDTQVHSSARQAARFMQEFPFRGRLIDVGCGLGGRALHWLERGAEHVVNVDINLQEIQTGRGILASRFPDRVNQITFALPSEVPAHSADGAILLDSFEHLTDPAAVLADVHRWLRPGGIVWIGSIGWYHYLASHCLGHVPLPWCQVFFSERAILDTIRSVIREPGYKPYVWEEMEGIGRWDGIKSLRDRPGEPLNMLSLRACKRVMAQSEFELREFRAYPLGAGRLGPLGKILAHTPMLRELFHGYYTATLRRKE